MKKILVLLLLFVATNTATAQKKMFLRCLICQGKKWQKFFLPEAQTAVCSFLMTKLY